MKSRLKVVVGVVVGFTLIALPRIVAAQGASSASIAGVVTDTSDAVLPGVTVEVTSPVLSEGVRSTVTDGEGRYQIVELRPGTYSITFTLPGFRTFIRDGVELPVNFTATINAELQVGALEETVTVTGESPLVDVRNVRDQARISREQIDTLPSNRGLYAYAAFTPAMVIAPRSQDVGGAQGEMKIAISVHGSREDDYKTRQDGMPVTNMQQSGSARGYVINPLVAGETVVDLGGGGSGEQSTGGAQVNVIPRDGTNTFAGTFFTSGTTEGLQGDNLTQEFRDLGVTQVNGIDEIHDFNVMFSGPIVRDKLWFLTAHRTWGLKRNIGDLYEQDRSTFPVYTPDLSKPAKGPENNRSHNGRLAWQATNKDKFTFNYDWQFYHGGNNQGRLSPTDRSFEVKGNAYCPHTRLYQANWQRPQTNRLLIEAGFSRTEFEMKRGGGDAASFTLPSGRLIEPYDDPACNDYGDRVAISEQNAGFPNGPALWNGSGSKQHRLQIHQNLRFTTTYVTGAHNVKVGLYTQHGVSEFYTVRAPVDTGGLPVAYRVRNGVPNRVTQYVSFLPEDMAMNEIALFAQDSWTIGDLTLNYGLRYEYLEEHAPPIEVPAGRLNDARSLPGVDCVPCWHDISPRFSVAYDPFGDGRTAIKASIGRYTAAGTKEIVDLFMPANSFVPSTNRTWTDANRDFVPDCDLRNLEANGECRAVSNSNFAGTELTSTPDPDWITGWGKRAYNWFTTVGVDRELIPGLAMNATFTRRWYKNQIVTDNILVTPADFDPYCVTAPVDARLGDKSGQEICGLYDIKPEKFGQEETVVTLAKNFGDYKEWFNGFDLGLQARFPNGSRLAGGFAVGNSAGDNAGTGSTRIQSERCFVVDSPQEGLAIPVLGGESGGLYNCKSGIPYRAQFKINGSYPLPWDFFLSGVFQNIPGSSYAAVTTFRSAAVSAGLGRPKSGGGNETIDLFAPFSQYVDDRINQFDLRVSKIVRAGRLRFQMNADAYNLFNASANLNPTGTYGTDGANYLRPIHTLDARIFRFGLQVDF